MGPLKRGPGDQGSQVSAVHAQRGPSSSAWKLAARSQNRLTSLGGAVAIYSNP